MSGFGSKTYITPSRRPAEKLPFGDGTPHHLDDQGRFSAVCGSRNCVRALLIGASSSPFTLVHQLLGGNEER